MRAVTLQMMCRLLLAVVLAMGNCVSAKGCALKWCSFEYKFEYAYPEVGGPDVSHMCASNFCSFLWPLCHAVILLAASNLSWNM